MSKTLDLALRNVLDSTGRTAKAELHFVLDDSDTGFGVMLEVVFDGHIIGKYAVRGRFIMPINEHGQMDFIDALLMDEGMSQENRARWIDGLRSPKVETESILG